MLVKIPQSSLELLGAGETPNSQRLGGVWGGNTPLITILPNSKKKIKKNKKKLFYFYCTYNLFSVVLHLIDM